MLVKAWTLKKDRNRKNRKNSLKREREAVLRDVAGGCVCAGC